MQFMTISKIKTFLNYQQVDYWDILFFKNMCYFFLFFLRFLHDSHILKEEKRQ